MSTATRGDAILPRETPLAGPTARSERAAAQLRDWLITGVLSPGEQLSEIAVAERLGISRNTLREVFRLLRYEGLVEHRPHRGVFVASPTADSIIDIYRTRRILECGALARALPAHPASVLMAEAISEARTALIAEDWARVGTANMAFHGAIIALADSPRLTAVYRNLAAELRLAFLGHEDPRFLHAPYVELNAAIYAAYQEGHPLEAARLLEEYLVQSERTLLAAHARRR